MATTDAVSVRFRKRREERCLPDMTRLGCAGCRFGDYVYVDCAIFPYVSVDAINLHTQNSPEFRSLDMTKRE